MLLFCFDQQVKATYILRMPRDKASHKDLDEIDGTVPSRVIETMMVSRSRAGWLEYHILLRGGDCGLGECYSPRTDNRIDLGKSWKGTEGIRRII